jgi:hypothetical protein
MIWFFFIINVILFAALLWRHYEYKTVIRTVKELVSRVEESETDWLDKWYEELVEQGIEEEEDGETTTR